MVSPNLHVAASSVAHRSHHAASLILPQAVASVMAADSAAQVQAAAVADLAAAVVVYGAAAADVAVKRNTLI